MFLLYFRNYLFKPDLQVRKCCFIFWLRPQYFWVGSKIFKKLPTVLNLKEKGIRALLFKRGLKKCDSSQLDCSKVADALLSTHQQYLLKDLHLCFWMTSLSPVKPSALQVFFQCKWECTRYTHTHSHCIKCLHCGAVHRCVPASAKWVVCTACHTTECQWQQKSCTRTATCFLLDCNVNHQHSHNNTSTPLTNVKYWDVGICSQELKSMSNC